MTTRVAIYTALLFFGCGLITGGLFSWFGFPAFAKTARAFNQWRERVNTKQSMRTIRRHLLSYALILFGLSAVTYFNVFFTVGLLVGAWIVYQAVQELIRLEMEITSNSVM